MTREEAWKLKQLARAAALAALTGLGAWIAIPLTAVPITLQGLFVYLTGLLLSPFWAGTAMLIYVLLGVVGLPVYAQGGAGLGVVIGPTGGYLFGFILGAVVLSALTQVARRRAAARSRALTFLLTLPGVVLCSAIVLTMGATWGKLATGLGWREILAGWVLPFLPGDAIKMILAILISGEIWRRKLGENGPSLGA